MRESKFLEPKYYDWHTLDERGRQHALALQDIKAREKEILSTVYLLLNKRFGLTEDKLILLEIKSLQRKAHQVAEMNCKLSKDLQNGLISKQSYGLSIISSPVSDVLYDYYRGYGVQPPLEFAEGRSFGDSDVYYEEYLKPRLLAARRERIKPFLDESNDVL